MIPLILAKDKKLNSCIHKHLQAYMSNVYSIKCEYTNKSVLPGNFFQQITCSKTCLKVHLFDIE